MPKMNTLSQNIEEDSCYEPKVRYILSIFDFDLRFQGHIDDQI